MSGPSQNPAARSGSLFRHNIAFLVKSRPSLCGSKSKTKPSLLETTHGVKAPTSDAEIEPMSWYWGSQLTQTVASFDESALVMTRRLWARLERPTMTPLGVDVLPEVYWRKAKAGGGLTGVIGVELMESVASHFISSVSSRSNFLPRRYAVEVRITDAPDALTIDSKWRAVRASELRGSGG